MFERETLTHSRIFRSASRQGMEPPSDVTPLLAAAREGSASARDEVLEVVYAELSRLAQAIQFLGDSPVIRFWQAFSHTLRVARTENPEHMELALEDARLAKALLQGSVAASASSSLNHRQPNVPQHHRHPLRQRLQLLPYFQRSPGSNRCRQTITPFASRAVALLTVLWLSAPICVTFDSRCMAVSWSKPTKAGRSAYRPAGDRLA